jgi:hypothetical protein
MKIFEDMYDLQILDNVLKFYVFSVFSPIISLFSVLCLDEIFCSL